MQEVARMAVDKLAEGRGLAAAHLHLRHENVALRDQLQGAVEALRQVREQFANGRGGYDEHDPVVRIVNAALERHGGQ